eukprot:Hpha_TRINITY_DN15773_c0_g2::TRINITY_DN15773_c0_g2_i1::g.38961::m.38961
MPTPSQSPDPRGLEPLFQAASSGDVRAVAAWHERQQAPGGPWVSVSERGPPPLSRTALHQAALEGHAAAVALLLRLGADPSVCDGEGGTALHLAAEAGHSDAVAALLAHTGSKSISVRDATGRTVADCANGNAQVLGILTRQLLASREGSAHRRPPLGDSEARVPSAGKGDSLQSDLMRQTHETNQRLVEMEERMKQQATQNEYLKECLTALATQLHQPLPPAPRESQSSWPQKGSPAVMEADEGRVRLRLSQQQDVAFQDLVWQERKWVVRNSRAALVSPQPRKNSGGTGMLQTADFGPGGTASSAAPRFGSVRSSVGAAAPQQPASRRVPAPVRDTPPVAEARGSLRRLWNQAPPPQSGGGPSVSPGACRGRDARLLTCERNELERELEELRRLRDARGVTPSPLKNQDEEDGEEGGMREGVWTLEARIMQRQREIDAVILAEQLASGSLGEGGEASELQHLLAAREAERLRHERMLYEEAARAAEQDSELRFAPHRRKLEMLEREHQESKRHTHETSPERTGGSGGGTRGDNSTDLVSPRRVVPKVGDTSIITNTNSPSTQPVRRDPADPIITEVPLTPPRKPFPPVAAQAAGPGPAAVNRSQPWPPAGPATTPRTFAPETAPTARAPPPPKPEEEPKVFLTRRERIAAGLAATGTGELSPTPAKGAATEVTSPYTQHAPPLRKLAEGIGSGSPIKPSSQ